MDVTINNCASKNMPVCKGERRREAKCCATLKLRMFNTHTKLQMVAAISVEILIIILVIFQNKRSSS